MTTLRDATLFLERGVNDALGDEITYAAAEGVPSTFNAWVEFVTREASPGRSSASLDAATIEVPIATVPVVTKEDRITVVVLPGRLFAPQAWERGPGGSTWLITPIGVRPETTNGG